MKLLIETFGNRSFKKSFKDLKEAKEYVLRNKAFIKFGEILNEGPLGSGGFTPTKFAKNLSKKTYKSLDNKSIAKKKDENGETILDILNRVWSKVRASTEKYKDMYMSEIKADSTGFYIVLNYKKADWMGHPNFASGTRKLRGEYINALSKKYGEKIPLVKLTSYIKRHSGKLPSEKDLENYLKFSVNSRYRANYKDRIKYKTSEHFEK